MKKFILTVCALSATMLIVGCGDSEEAARKAAVEGDGYDSSAVEENPVGGPATPAEPVGSSGADSSSEDESD